MISDLGNSLQIASIIFAIIAIITAKKKYSGALFYSSCFCTISSFFLLVYSFIVSDFSVRNVFMNSSTMKPLLFKIAASWASHEGSIMLWLSLLGAISCLYLYFSTREHKHSITSISNPIIAWRIIILSAIQLLFASFIYCTSNPFEGLSFIPVEGLGLNPVLQDIALIIHPPILYFGYLCYIAPFTAACLVLLDKSLYADVSLFRLAKIFANIGIIAITIGIALGSWWAYRELGWGGYWFFDPVENISLMPWFAAIGLHHSLPTTLRTGRLLYWTIILSLITFLLVILGTFLVRSGIIISIHSFASSPDRGLYMLIIFTILSSLSIGLLLITKQKIHPIYTNSFSPFVEKGIIIGNTTWLIALVVLLFSVFYPVVLFILGKESVSVDPQYFINIFIPICLFLCLLAAFVSTFGKDYLDHIVILIATILCTLIISFRVTFGIISLIACFSSILLILHMLQLLITASNFFQKIPAAKTLSMIFAHAGFGILILSCMMNHLQQTEADFIGKIGDKTSCERFDIHLNDIQFAIGSNYYRQIVELSIYDKHTHNVTILKPENRLYMIEKTLSQESDIYSYLTHDLYAILNRIEGDVIHAKIYYRPFISYIWLSLVIMISGFLISIIYSKQP